MGSLQGKVALVTGGAAGVGRAVVEAYLDQGARVGVLDRDAERVDQLRHDLGDDVVATVGSVERLADNQRAVSDVLDRFGRLDVFVGNAGVGAGNLSLADIPLDRLESAIDEIYDINVKGYLLLAKAALPALVVSRGSMIFTISNAGFYTEGGGPLYTASKHAAVGLVRQLAFELAPHVRVNGVAPAASTPIFAVPNPSAWVTGRSPH